MPLRKYLSIIGLMVSVLCLIAIVSIAQIVSPPVTLDIAITNTAMPTFQLANELSSSSIGAHAVSLGTVFQKGAVPSGSGIGAVINGVPTAAQLDCKNTWADTTCKNGIISFIAPSMPASTTYTVTTSLAAAGGTPIDLSTLSGSGYTLSTTVAIKALQNTTDGATYNTNWMTELNNALSGGSCSYWRQGPVVSECRINKDLEGSLHLQADIARYSDGSVQVDMIALNDYYNETTSGHRRYYYTVTQNGSSVVNYNSGVGVAQSLYQTRHDRFWSNGNPAHVIHHDTAYLISSNVVLAFSYHDALPSGYSEANVAAAMAVPNWGGIFPYNNIDPSFTAGGGSPAEIGYYTGHNFALMNGNNGYKKVYWDYVMGQADVSGSIPWHQFDKANNRLRNVIDNYSVWYDTRDTSFTRFGCEQMTSGNLMTTAQTAIGNNILHFGAGSLPGTAPTGNNIWIGQDNVGLSAGSFSAPFPGPTSPRITAINTSTGDVTISANATSTIPAGTTVNFSCNWRPNGLHPPSLVTLPYILTGERYYLDEQLAETNWTQIGSWPPTRQGGDTGTQTIRSDIVINWQSNVRQQAWNYRQIIDSRFLIPDDTSYAPYAFWKTNLPIISLDNANYTNNLFTYIIPLTGEVYGWMSSGAGYSLKNPPPPPVDGTCNPADSVNAAVMPVWQQTYLVVAIAMAIKREIDTAANTQFLNYVGNWVTQSFQPHTGWDRRNGGGYYIAHCNWSTQIFAKTWADVANDSAGHTPCVNNNCMFSSTGWVGANYQWMGTVSNSIIAYVFGSTGIGPTALDNYNYMKPAIVAGGMYPINAEPQWQYTPTP